MPLRRRVMEDVAEVFGVLSHATRLRIITLLHQGEFDVSEIGARLEVSVTNISQHLALLRSHHLVSVRREGTRVYYRITDPRVADLINRALDILAEDMSHAGEVQKAIKLVRLKS